jgi:predicted RNA-binding Zn ribbon-like protein
MVTQDPVLDYRSVGGALCLDFVDSVDRAVGKPLVETLTTYAALCRWSAQAGSLPRAWLRVLSRSRETRATAAVLERAIALREACFGVFLAISVGERPPAENLALVNRELGWAGAHQSVRETLVGFSLQWSGEGHLDAPLWPIAQSAADVLVKHDRDRVRRCAGEGCLWLFLDTSKNGRRRWCEMQVCGNRAKVRAHRRRHARA